MAAKENNSLDDLIGALRRGQGRRLPPVEDWHPDFCGKIDIHVSRDGRWHYQGTPIGREALVKLFASVLRRDAEDGPYFLVTPAEMLEIRVDVAPLLIVDATVEGEGGGQRIVFSTNMGDVVPLGPDHPLRIVADPDGPLPLVRLRGRIDGLIARPVYYRLAELAVPGPHHRLGLWSQGKFFALEADDAGA